MGKPGKTSAYPVPKHPLYGPEQVTGRKGNGNNINKKTSRIQRVREGGGVTHAVAAEVFPGATLQHNTTTAPRCTKEPKRTKYHHDQRVPSINRRGNLSVCTIRSARFL